MMHTSILRSKALNLDGSINNPAMHGNFTNIPIDMGSEWMYVGTDIESESDDAVLCLCFSLPRCEFNPY